MIYRLVVGLGTALILAEPAMAGSARSLAILVSRDTQSLAVYDGDQVVATSNVSTGKPGHSTPTGIFTILEKQKYHESNLYSSAPMPFMQRITWSGVALHESNSVPRRPASHGCVRLPHDFAKLLYGMTETGVPVVIADEELTPSAYIHPFLFRPANPAGNGMLLSEAKLRLNPITDFLQPIEVAANEAVLTPAAPPEAEDKGLRILITRRGQADLVKDIQVLLNTLGYTAGEPDGHLGNRTVAAINAFKLTKDLPSRGNLISDSFVDALFQAAGKPKPPQGQLYVRRNFKPLFDGPVTLVQPEAALGTHFLQLRAMDPQLGMADWYGFTVPDGMSEATRKRLGINQETVSSLSEVMDRIVIPPELREKIEAALTTGSIITITDGGMGRETGAEGTDFITLTHPVRDDG